MPVGHTHILNIDRLFGVIVSHIVGVKGSDPGKPVLTPEGLKDAIKCAWESLCEGKVVVESINYTWAWTKLFKPHIDKAFG